MDDDVTVQSVMDKIKLLLDAEIDCAATLSDGDDLDVTDEQRARWDAAPSLEEIERDLKVLEWSMAAYDG